MSENETSGKRAVTGARGGSSQGEAGWRPRGLAPEGGSQGEAGWRRPAPAPEGGSRGELAGKVALVTGAASGIGYATAARLREAGATPALLDLDEAGGSAAAGRLDGLFVRADVGSPADWARAVAQVVAELGGLDIAHLNAGVTTSEADVTAVTDEQYRRICGANLDGVFFGLRAVVPAIQARGGGAIVATSSIAGLTAYSPDPVYTMTKHGVVGLVRAVAPQLKSKKITINAICPGLVDTPLLALDARELARAANFPLIPASEIADAVLGCVVGTESGQAFVCQVGRRPTAYRFGGVPGPGGTAAGRTPPAGLAADEELRRQ